MPTITYVEHNGAEHSLTVDAGATIMEAAIDNEVPGIDADCGGACACGTCHVYIDASWKDKMDPRSDSEEGMLSLAVEVSDESRLACQITLTDELDGLRIRLPESQY